MSNNIATAFCEVEPHQRGGYAMTAGREGPQPIGFALYCRFSTYEQAELAASAAFSYIDENDDACPQCTARHIAVTLSLDS